jgi:4-amino-4-deoxy-L-arabinose transferase-like glycosyltransferase
MMEESPPGHAGGSASTDVEPRARALCTWRTARVPLVVALAAALLYFAGLGHMPLVDASEGFHVAIAWEMATRGDWITPHFDGIRYFDKPPLLYWLTAGTFRVFGLSEWTARLWPVLAAVGVATLTAWLGARLSSPRVGLVAGLMVAANPGIFLFGRFAKPDLLFVFFILLAFCGLTVAYQTASRRALLLAHASLGAAVLAKDILGVLGPLAVFALFLTLTGDRSRPSRWVPWSGVLLFILITVPWHAAMELRNPGFLRYMLIDNHILNVAELRVFPDEDVSLNAPEFLGATALAFFPWSLTLPWSFHRIFRRPWGTDTDRLWVLIGLWAAGFLAVVAASPFKLPHYGLPAFPALALLAAKVWDDVLARRAGAPALRRILALPLVVLITVTLVSLAAWTRRVLVPSGVLSVVDLHNRNQGAKGVGAPFIPYEQLVPWLAVVTAIFAVGSLGVGLGLVRNRPIAGLASLMLVVVAFLPVTSQGMTLLAEARSPRPIIEFLARTVGPDDVVVHEGAMENTGSLVFALGRQVKILNGLRSNLAFGATFPEGRHAVWNVEQLRREWDGPRRIFLVSAEATTGSVVNGLPGERVRLLLEVGGRRLYSNCDVEVPQTKPVVSRERSTTVD